MKPLLIPTIFHNKTQTKQGKMLHVFKQSENNNKKCKCMYSWKSLKNSQNM